MDAETEAWLDEAAKLTALEAELAVAEVEYEKERHSDSPDPQKLHELGQAVADRRLLSRATRVVLGLRSEQLTIGGDAVREG